VLEGWERGSSRGSSEYEQPRGGDAGYVMSDNRYYVKS
jgi:hypothetical protein